MARVGSGSAAEVLAQLKEQYLARERENEERHKSEIQEIRSQYRAEIQKLKEDSQNQIRDLQEESSAKLNQKDLQNQKEIEAVKALFIKRAMESKKPV